MSPADRERLAAACLAAALAACLFYAVDRSIAAIRNPIDPRMIVATVRIEYFWRVGLSAFVASLVGIGWFTRAPAGWTRHLARGIWPVAVFCGALAFIFP
jgi:hypothetical protein